VALRICQLAKRRAPDRPEVYWCVGRIAALLDRPTLGIVNLEHAVRLVPESRRYAEALAQLYQRRLFNLIGDEKLDEAQRELRRIERFYQRSKAHFKEPLQPPLSGVHYAIGQGMYNAGKIAHAKTAFERSVAMRPSPDALLQLAAIQIKHNNPAAAEKHLAKAGEASTRTAVARAYVQGRVEELRGRALELAGKLAESRSAHRRAVTAWKALQAMRLDSELEADAYIHEARSQFALGERAKGMDTLDRAIDVTPDRKETYADVIALLTTYGHLPEALDAYHRALGRREVSEYLKSYCSFWIIGLARRAGLPPDPLAMNHLANLKGTAWYTELSKLIRGKATYEGLLAKAKGPSNLAELYYYQADLLLAQGKHAPARQLWQKVVSTEMMAFYEYDMAAFNLRHGPAVVSTSPLDRQQPSAYNRSRRSSKRRSGPRRPSNGR
jgi:tetratricopeptide (TPR) repeat protein